MIQNLPGASNPGSAVGLASRSVEEVARIPEDTRTPVFVRRGVALDTPAEMILPESDGSIRISIPEVTRIAVYLNREDMSETQEDMVGRGERILNKTAAFDARYEAYELVLGQLRPLPIGATFDSRDGVLYWQPGPWFLGEYKFILVDGTQNTKKTIIIRIGPAVDA